jgi:hypothetical protein
MFLIRKVWHNKWTDQLIITIPNSNPEGIEANDYVIIKLLVPKFEGIKCFKCKKKYLDHTIRELEEHGLVKKIAK